GIAKWLRQRSAKPLFSGSNPDAASNLNQEADSQRIGFFLRRKQKEDGEMFIEKMTRKEAAVKILKNDGKATKFVALSEVS
ncbi:MAG TPA: hypothetical protein PKM79_08570, partial [Smithellaceae bacterium]|nr:hypothetical protein [Smithellaceae bacterium]